MSQDRLPPHDDQAERAIIGCALQDAAHAPELRPEWFYDERYRIAADAILALAAEGSPVNFATVTQRLAGRNLPDAAQVISECDDACHSPANFPYWRDILTEKKTLRRMIQTAQAAIAGAQGADRDGSNPAEVLDAYERDVLAIAHGLNGDGNAEVDIKAALLELTDEYEQAATQGRPRGLATGYCDLDRMLGGLKPGQLVIVAARPAVGKTSLALGIAEHVAVVERVPVGFFSLEMSGKELVQRLACSLSRVDAMRLNEGRATGQDIQAAAVAHGRISKAPMHICDRGGLTMAQLTATARRMVHRSSIKLLIVDYLGLLRSGEKGRSRYEETTLVSNGLKLLAKELGLPVICLAQLNRDNDREGRVPRMSDLRDSGAIEQDADVVALLHADENQTGDCQTVNVIIAKQRSGRTGKADLLFNRTCTRFESVSRV